MEQNCLGFALRMWQNNVDYKIWYNSDHAININTSTQVIFKGDMEFLPLEEFGLTPIYNSHKNILSTEELQLLVDYFSKYNSKSYVTFIKNLPNDYSFVSPIILEVEGTYIKYEKKIPKFSEIETGQRYVTLMGAEPYIVICVEKDYKKYRVKFLWVSNILGTQSIWYNMIDWREYIRFIIPQK